MAWDAKVSLESKDMDFNASRRMGINDPMSKDFVRYFNAKRLTDAQTSEWGGTVEGDSVKGCSSLLGRPSWRFR